MKDVLSYFRETEDVFTVYVVEQKFAIGQGYEYFSSFKGKDNILDTNYKTKKFLGKVLKWIQKNIPNVADLINSCYMSNIMSLTDIVIILSKLFAVEEHQAAGPNVLDPIIIQEGCVSARYITQLINLHKNSILRPVIIIILKDNNFERAKMDLSSCPNGCNIKFIRNSGECEICKIINPGSNNIASFLDAFAQQCFSTCSQTKRDIVLNKEWSNNHILNKYYPLLLKIRSNLLFDEKNEIKSLLDSTIDTIHDEHSTNTNDEILYRSLECMYDLQWVICNDTAGDKLSNALKLAQDTNNDILLAHVYRHADLMPNINYATKFKYLNIAEQIFENYHIEDHAIYCKNNRLVMQFDHENIKVREFHSLQEKAVNDVPGLCGMSHILNNVGLAYLMTGNPDEAIEFFDKGLKYAKYQDRSVQKLALLTNKLIARVYNFDKVNEKELRQLMNQIFDNMGLNQLPFISARYIMNLIVIAIMEHPFIVDELFNQYPIIQLLQKGLYANALGTGQILLQLDYVNIHYPNYSKYFNLRMPNKIYEVTGQRRDFILRYGLNPFYFCTWL